jgi:hypothetical protein
LLKSNDRGNKKALIGNTNQGFNALEGSKKFEPSSDVCRKALVHQHPVHRGHTNPSGSKCAAMAARFVTGCKRKQFVMPIFHRGADYTDRKMFVNNKEKIILHRAND